MDDNCTQGTIVRRGQLYAWEVESRMPDFSSLSTGILWLDDLDYVVVITFSHSSHIGVAGYVFRLLFRSFSRGVRHL